MVFLGLEKMTWFQIGLNTVFVGVHAWSYSLNASITPALAMGFHVGLIVSVVMIDRIFLAPIREEIAALDGLIARLRRQPPPSQAQGNHNEQ